MKKRQKGLHRHHIVPRHAGGTDDDSNIVYLTPDEHAQAHLTLYETYGKMEDLIAYRGLSGMQDSIECISQIQSHAVSKANKTRVWTEEGRAKLAQACRDRAVPVYCPELDKTWEGGYMEAARELDIKHECIRRVVRGQRKRTHGLTFHAVG